MRADNQVVIIINHEHDGDNHHDDNDDKDEHYFAASSMLGRCLGRASRWSSSLPTVEAAGERFRKWKWEFVPSSFCLRYVYTPSMVRLCSVYVFYVPFMFHQLSFFVVSSLRSIYVPSAVRLCSVYFPFMFQLYSVPFPSMFCLCSFYILSMFHLCSVF